jgi:hypothetical protein
MSPPVDDRYLEWLYKHFAAVRNRNPARSYWKLAKQLYTTEFVWLIPNDDNRVEDGVLLREEFVSERGSDGVTQEWMALGCSVLEMMVALANRAADLTGEEAADWMQRFFTNLDIVEYRDNKYNKTAQDKTNDILEVFIYRAYREDGQGGLFPLQHSSHDQTKVELWYQLNEYILENE